MTLPFNRCPVCHGRGAIRCDCWPGDCICGWDDEHCDNCDGTGDAGYKGSDADLDAFNVAAFAGWLGGNRDRPWVTIRESDAHRDLILSRLPELRGKPLACWCKPGSPCHADVLIKLANEVPG